MGLGGQDYSTHVHTCPFREKPCVDCKQMVDIDVEEQVRHDKVCANKIISCLHCKSEMIRDKLMEHEKKCVVFPLECEFKWLGAPACQPPIPRRNYHDHCAEMTIEHLELLSTAHKKLTKSAGEVKSLNPSATLCKDLIESFPHVSWTMRNWKSNETFSFVEKDIGDKSWSMEIDKDGCENKSEACIDLKADYESYNRPRCIEVIFINSSGIGIKWQRFDQYRSSGCVNISIIDSILDEDGSIGVYTCVIE